jgi:hypothetical protein
LGNVFGFHKMLPAPGSSGEMDSDPSKHLLAQLWGGNIRGRMCV